MNRPAASFGGPIFVIVLGAIVAFALNINISGVDDNLLGFILMGAGAAWLVFELMTNGRRSSLSTSDRVVTDDGTGPVVSERQSTTSER